MLVSKLNVGGDDEQEWYFRLLIINACFRVYTMCHVPREWVLQPTCRGGGGGEGGLPRLFELPIPSPSRLYPSP